MRVHIDDAHGSCCFTSKQMMQHAPSFDALSPIPPPILTRTIFTLVFFFLQPEAVLVPLDGPLDQPRFGRAFPMCDGRLQKRCSPLVPPSMWYVRCAVDDMCWDSNSRWF